MPTIRTTFAGLPVEAEYGYDQESGDYILDVLMIGNFFTEPDDQDCIAVMKNGEWEPLSSFLNQLVSEQRGQWDIDERRATRELERGE